MQQGRGRDQVFWAIPLAIACVAAFFAYRWLRVPSWEPPPKDEATELRLNPCAPGHQRCRGGELFETTGERGDGGQACAWRSLGRCQKACVAEDVTYAGVDLAVAKRQLCDPPADVAPLIAGVTSNLDKKPDEVPSCEADGYAPTDTEIVQCVLRSKNDPNALGVVIASIRCHGKVVPTVDRTPRLITKEQAVALWCEREAGAGAGAASGSAASSVAGSAAPSVSGSASAAASGSASGARR
jgi:hypothetical protein